jgi:phosphatidylethanolamine-binding protein (PEBP) family uncharacterized protein
MSSTAFQLQTTAWKAGQSIPKPYTCDGVDTSPPFSISVPTGAIQIMNSSGTARWSGPCPTSGTNSYEFALYALSSPSGLTTSASLADVNAAIALSKSASVVNGTYSR